MALAVKAFDGVGDVSDHEVIDITGAFTIAAVIKRTVNGT